MILPTGLEDLLAKPWRSIQWTAEYVEICLICGVFLKTQWSILMNGPFLETLKNQIVGFLACSHVFHFLSWHNAWFAGSL